MTPDQITRKYQLEALPKPRLLSLLTDARRAAGIRQVSGAPPVLWSKGEIASEIAELEVRQ